MTSPTNPEVLPLLTAWEPSRPRLTWYGDDGERVELSGRVLRNWVVKAANLLVAECDAGPGTSVRLDLPAHWRLLVWALAVRAAGAEVLLGDDGGDPVVVVTDHPERWSGGAVEVVAVPLPALARAWPGDLPAGALDGAADLMGQPDEPMFAASGPAGARTTGAPGARVLLEAHDPAALLERAWACWREDGSVVVVTPREDDAVATIREQEGAVAEDPLRGR